MGSSNYYADGQWNFTCDLCGRQKKSGNGIKTWDNMYVCKHHQEKRNPQDFVRGVRENQTVPWSRVNAIDNFPFCVLLDEKGNPILQENLYQLLLT